MLPSAPRLRISAQKVKPAVGGPAFWVPSLLLVAPFMRWAHRHWSVPPTVLRELRGLLGGRLFGHRLGELGADCSSVWAGASGSATGCSVTPSFAVIVSSFIGGEGFARFFSSTSAVRTLDGDVAFGLDIARQSGWEVRDSQDGESVSRRDDHCREDYRAQEFCWC